MPEPLDNRPGASAVVLLEEALHTLRRAPFSTWLLHWTGSVPFAFALILFWRDVNARRGSAATCLWDALLLALTLGWMNTWRAVFAARLRDQLSGETPARLKIPRIAASQIFLGALKVFVQPFSLLIIFPFAPVKTFFRYATALAARPDLDALQVISRAARLARIQQKRSWVVAAALAFVQLAVLLNVAMGLALLPFLAKMLTGIDTEFSRAGGNFLSTPLFFITAIAVGWLAFDPFAQAAYSVMCFRVESLETGEDIRVALRRLRLRAATAIAASLLLLIALPLRAQGTIPPDRLQGAVKEALKSHEYDWRFPPGAPQIQQKSWLVKVVDTIAHWLTSGIRSIGHAIGKLFDWLLNRLRGIIPESNGGAAPSAALNWTVYLLGAVILALLAFLAWRFYKTRRGKAAPAPKTVPVVRLEDETVTADRLPEEEWLRMAEARLREGDFRLALRAFYLANLAWMGRGDWIAIDAGKTNREYQRELRKRARGLPAAESAEANELFAENLTAFERVWYGMHAIDNNGVEAYRERNRRMKALLVRVTAPVGVAA